MAIQYSREFRYIAPVYKKTGDFLLEEASGLYAFVPYLILGLVGLYLLGVKNGFTQGGILFFSLFQVYMYIGLKTEISKRLILGEMPDAYAAVAKNPKNPKKIKYYSRFGRVVHDFKGESAAAAQALNLADKNVDYDLILGKSLFTMGALFAGATGSGKTVALEGAVMMPAIETGSGLFYIEGKGDRTISEGVYARCVQHGREEDVFFLDFGAVISGGFSHTVSPLAVGSAVVLKETMVNMINILTGENSWVTDKAQEAMQSVLFPLVLFRDLKLFVDVKHIDKIAKLEDLKKAPKVEFNLTQLSGYMTIKRIIDLAYTFRALLKDKEFVALVKEHEKHKAINDLEKTYLSPILHFLETHSVPVSDELKPKPDASKLQPEILKQLNYGIQPWTDALLKFGNEAIYGRIFNAEYSDFSALDAIRQGKIVIASLPSLQNSPDNNQKIGKLLTALIKNALGEMLSEGDMEGTESEKERAMRLRPTKLPYTLIFDEISNYGSPMLGQISSMCRSIGTEKGGIGIIISGQSKTDLSRIDDGKNIESEQLLANIGVSVFLNLTDKGYAEHAAELAGKEEFYTEDMFSHRDEKGAKDTKLSLNEKEMFQKDFFTKKLRKQTGEAIVCINGAGVARVVTTYYPTIKVDKTKLSRNISESKLMSYFTETSNAA